MTLKLIDVPPEISTSASSQHNHHDFLLVSHTISPSADATRFTGAVAVDPAAFTFAGVFAPSTNWANQDQTQPLFALGTDVLRTRWSSALPSRYGAGRALKYAARPCVRSAPAISSDPNLSARTTSAGLCVLDQRRHRCVARCALARFLRNTATIHVGHFQAALFQSIRARYQEDFGRHSTLRVTTALTHRSLALN